MRLPLGRIARVTTSMRTAVAITLLSAIIIGSAARLNRSEPECHVRDDGGSFCGDPRLYPGEFKAPPPAPAPSPPAPALLIPR
jgi:hypothetical protein